MRALLCTLLARSGGLAEEKRGGGIAPHRGVLIKRKGPNSLISCNSIPLNFTSRYFVSFLYYLQDSDLSSSPAAASGGWVAECVVFRNIGRLIRRFRSTQHLMEALAEAKARMKMHVYGGAHKQVQFGGREHRVQR